MKLFLASHGIQPHLQKDFLELVNKPSNKISFAYITNAADPYPPEKRGWMEDVAKMFAQASLTTTVVDLKDFTDPVALKAKLKKFDVIWCGGGNTWYLRYVINNSGFDQIIKSLLQEGVVFGGDSAGAIIMGPTLKYTDLLDDPNVAPLRVEEGLKLVDYCIVPHWNSPKYANQLNTMRSSLLKDGYKVKCITDSQAIIINGDEVRKI